MLTCITLALRRVGHLRLTIKPPIYRVAPRARATNAPRTSRSRSGRTADGSSGVYAKLSGAEKALISAYFRYCENRDIPAGWKLCPSLCPAIFAISVLAGEVWGAVSERHFQFPLSADRRPGSIVDETGSRCPSEIGGPGEEQNAVSHASSAADGSAPSHAVVRASLLSDRPLERRKPDFPKLTHRDPCRELSARGTKVHDHREGKPTSVNGARIARAIGLGAIATVALSVGLRT